MYSNVFGLFTFEVKVREGTLVVVEAKVLKKEEECKQTREETTHIRKYIYKFSIWSWYWVSYWRSGDSDDSLTNRQSSNHRLWYFFDLFKRSACL